MINLNHYNQITNKFNAMRTKLFYFLFCVACLTSFTPENLSAQTTPDNSNTITTVKTDDGTVKIPGIWQKVTYEASSKQHFMKNEEGVVIAVALTSRKLYPFNSPKKTEKELATDFFKWDFDFRTENKFKTQKLKENTTENYIIWKYTENKIDNIYLYGCKSDLMVNYLVYTDTWTEQKKIEFLEDMYKLNYK